MTEDQLIDRVVAYSINSTDNPYDLKQESKVEQAEMDEIEGLINEALLNENRLRQDTFKRQTEIN